jgi:hypothetical protein
MKKSKALERPSSKSGAKARAPRRLAARKPAASSSGNRNQTEPSCEIRGKVKSYPPLPESDSQAIENVQSQFLREAMSSNNQQFYAVVVSCEVAYPYGISRVGSHRAARALALRTHTELSLPTPERITVVGICRQPECACGNAVFALQSQRTGGKGRWRHF